MLLNCKKRKNERGFAIALALLMLVAMSLMGATLMVIAAGAHKRNGNQNVNQQTVCAAETGISEAKKSGKLIKKNSINIDVSFTSYLKRAIRTLTIILEENQKEKKFNASWQMNERHYGSLTGLNKKETLEKLGEKKFKMYRRSWETSPPPIPDNDDIA